MNHEERRFWEMEKHYRDSDKTVRVDGKLFSIGVETGGFLGTMPMKDRGHGGAEFNIRFDDGRLVRSTNLWFRAYIPEEYKAEFPSNAKFLTREQFQQEAKLAEVKRVGATSQYEIDPAYVRTAEERLAAVDSQAAWRLGEKKWEEFKQTPEYPEHREKLAATFATIRSDLEAATRKEAPAWAAPRDEVALTRDIERNKEILRSRGVSEEFLRKYEAEQRQDNRDKAQGKWGQGNSR